MGTDDGWWNFNFGTSTWTDITDAVDPLTGSRSNQQVFKVFPMSGTSYLIGCNGVDTPKKWDGAAANYSALAGSPPISRCMAIAFNRVIMGNLQSGLTVSPYAVDVSGFNNAETGWGGINISLLADTPGEIVAICEMGNLMVAILKSDAIYAGLASPSLYPFTYELKAKDIKGPVSSLAAVTLSDGLIWWLGEDGSISQFDTSSITLVSRAAQVQIQRTCAPDMMAHAFGFFDSYRQEVWFVYPALGGEEPMRAVIIGRNTFSVWPQKWATRQIAAGGRFNINIGMTFDELAAAGTTFDEMTRTFDELDTETSRLVFGDVGGQVYQEGGSDDASDAVELEFETGYQALSVDPRRYIELHTIEHQFEPTVNAQNVLVEVGVSDDGREPTFGAGQTLDISEAGPYLTEYRKEGKRLAMKLSASATETVTYRGSIATGHAKGIR
jgi:hypothetical protein